MSVLALGRHKFQEVLRSGGIIRVEGSLKSALELGLTRFQLVVFCIVGFYAYVAYSMFMLATDGASVEKTRLVMPAAVQIARRDITDRNGVLLATNLKTPSLYANPRVMRAAGATPKEAASALVKMFPDLKQDVLEKKFASPGSFVWVKRNLSPEQQYAVNNLGIPGLAWQTEEKRIYPQGAISAHVIGMVGIDGQGLAGMERKKEQLLVSEIDRNKPLALTVDVRVQEALRSALARQVEKFSAKGAAGLVMDVNNGEILAMVSLPDYDPNQPGKISSDSIFNRTTLGAYEMGSTFKAFTMAMALDEGVITLRDSYDISQPIRIGRFRISDYHPHHGSMTVADIFMNSSNIGTVKIAKDVGIVRQKTFLSKMGFLKKMNADLPELANTLYPASWTEASLMTISFGHGMAVTPVHLAAGYAALVNGGVYYKPTLVKQDVSKAPEGEQVIRETTSLLMRKLLRLVVEEGTGKFAEVPGYAVGGKTGTAEKSTASGYNKKAMISSFMGVFPMNKPRFVVLAMVDEPRCVVKNVPCFATGGWVSAPVVHDVVQQIGPMLGIKPVDMTDPNIIRQLQIEAKFREPSVVTN